MAKKSPLQDMIDKLPEELRSLAERVLTDLITAGQATMIDFIASRFKKDAGLAAYRVIYKAVPTDVRRKRSAALKKAGLLLNADTAAKRRRREEFLDAVFALLMKWLTSSI